MEEVLIEFKENLERFAEEKLRGLDGKIARIEEKLTGKKLLELAEKRFRFERRLARLERNKFGYDFSTHNNNNGDN